MNCSISPCERARARSQLLSQTHRPARPSSCTRLRAQHLAGTLSAAPHRESASAGTCKWAGARGGLAVLDVIETTPFKQVYLQLLPMLGGYQAGYLAYDIANRAVGLVICAQLVITEPGVSPLTAPAATMAAAARCVIRVIAHSASRDAIDSMRSNPENWLQARLCAP